MDPSAGQELVGSGQGMESATKGQMNLTASKSEERENL